MSDRLERHDVVADPEPPLVLSHVVHTVTAYRGPIFLSLAVVALLYAIIAIALLLRTPSVRVTSVPFRLEFAGASRGEYPNGAKFNTSEIVSVPILLSVYRTNGLESFVSFGDFSHSIFVLGGNDAYERFAGDYQARLADPKLSPADREKLQAEFDAQRQSAANDGFSINFLRTSATSRVPDLLVRKTLNDVLTTWSQRAVRLQHVLSFPTTMLSPQVVTPPAAPTAPIVAAELLRMNTNQLLLDIDSLERVPGAAAVRTQDQMSLEEVRLRLDELKRFSLEPMIASLAASNPAGLRFLDSQLAYAQRNLQLAQSDAAAVRDALAAYSMEQRAPREVLDAIANAGREPRNPSSTNSETVVPQLSETFIDRLVALTNQAADVKYRQHLVDDYRLAAARTLPLQEEVAFYTRVISDAKTGGTGSVSPLPSIEAVYGEARNLCARANEIYSSASQTMNPSMQLFTLTGPTITQTQRSVSVIRPILLGILLVLLALPVVVILALLHNRVRDEEALETAAHTVKTVAT